MGQFRSGVGGGEVPCHFGGLTVASGVPGLHFALQRLLVGDPSIEALTRQNAQFNLRDIEPTAVTWRVDKI